MARYGAFLAGSGSKSFRASSCCGRREHVRLHYVVGGWGEGSFLRGMIRSGIWVRVDLETMANLNCRGPSLHKFLIVVGLVCRELCTDIAHRRVKTGVDKLGIVLFHHLLLNHGLILCLLRKSRTEEEKLSRNKGLQNECIQNRHTWSGVERS